MYPLFWDIPQNVDIKKYYLGGLITGDQEKGGLKPMYNNGKILSQYSEEKLDVRYVPPSHLQLPQF